MLVEKVDLVVVRLINQSYYKVLTCSLGILVCTVSLWSSAIQIC